MVTDLLTHVMDGAAAPCVGTDCPDWAQHYTGAPAIDPTETEIMSIGFSDGGGMSMYMQWMSAFTNETVGITQVIAIDYWAHNAYDEWLTNWRPYQNPRWLPGALDAKIYTNCYSGIFRDNGPMAIFPDKNFPTETTLYPVMGGFGTPSVSAGYWKSWNWVQPNCQRFNFWVHGLDSHAVSKLQSSNWKGNSSWWADQMCTSPNQQPAAVNSSVHWAVAVYTTGNVMVDIYRWVFRPKGIKSQKSCTYSVHTKEDDGKIAEPSTKIYIEEFREQEEDEGGKKEKGRDDERGRMLSVGSAETMEDLKAEVAWKEKAVFKVPKSTSKYTVAKTTPMKAMSKTFVNVALDDNGNDRTDFKISDRAKKYEKSEKYEKGEKSAVPMEKMGKMLPRGK